MTTALPTAPGAETRPRPLRQVLVRMGLLGLIVGAVFGVVVALLVELDDVGNLAVLEAVQVVRGGVGGGAFGLVTALLPTVLSGWVLRNRPTSVWFRALLTAAGAAVTAALLIMVVSGFTADPVVPLTCALIASATGVLAARWSW